MSWQSILKLETATIESYAEWVNWAIENFDGKMTNKDGQDIRQHGYVLADRNMDKTKTDSNGKLIGGFSNTKKHPNMPNSPLKFQNKPYITNVGGSSMSQWDSRPYDFTNPKDLILSAKDRFKLDLNDPKILEYFLKHMAEKYNQQVQGFSNVKGLLPETTSPNSQKEKPDYYLKQIKEVIHMYSRMNKPITKEIIIDEIGMDESYWLPSHDSLLE